MPKIAARTRATTRATTNAPSASTTNYRPSAAWTPQDDQTLMNAHAKGMTWKPISQKYFPDKSPNACRKRHERLMDRRNAQSWDGLKLERLAAEYMSRRKEIWSPLADAVGEKWQFVEAKCMEKGLSNLTSAARGVGRRSAGASGMEFSFVKDDDSGIAMEDEAEMDVGRRRRSIQSEGAPSSSFSRAPAEPAVPTIPETLHTYQRYPAPSLPPPPPPPLQTTPPRHSISSQSSQPPSSSAPNPTADSRRSSYGFSISSLLSPNPGR